jgi:hypothetical protein
MLGVPRVNGQVRSAALIPCASTGVKVLAAMRKYLDIMMYSLDFGCCEELDPEFQFLGFPSALLVWKHNMPAAASVSKASTLGYRHSMY